MEQITIDFKNTFDCSKKEKSKVCRKHPTPILAV